MLGCLELKVDFSSMYKIFASNDKGAMASRLNFLWKCEFD
jgi:hypothetical protein